MTSIELLSPARNLECGIAAIDHGADAVYIGAPRFGARAAAGNSVQDIRELCAYAHRFRARVYVALNTLLRPEEREPAERLAWQLHEAGIDALIVQDTAVLSMDLPPVPLHASTQMDNRTPRQAQWLREHGYEQIVLARELGIDQIRQIHQAVPDVPLEVFVHGALCVSYSGRCYASEHCFSRSANRGECAQFCRLPFDLQDAEGNVLVRQKHLLSLRDMNRMQHLEEMMDAGVRSFKIEGRLKDVSYVKNVTAAYRQALDRIFSRRTEYVRSSLGQHRYTFTPNPAAGFSRGFTDYFLHGRTPDMASLDTPKSRGVEVGRVREIRRGCIIVAGTASFSNGDGLTFLDADGRLQGFRVNRAEGNHLYPAQMPPVRKGDVLWRNHDHRLERLLEHPDSATRRIPITLTLAETPEGYELAMNGEGGLHHALHFSAEHQTARTDQSAAITDVLGKWGNSSYLCTSVDINFSEPRFIPRSRLAEWRRALQQCAEQSYSMPHEHAEANPVALDHEVAEHVEASPRTPSDIDAGPTPMQDITQPLMTCRYCIRHQMGWCPHRNQHTSVHSSTPLYLHSLDGRRFRLSFDCRNCQMQVFVD